MSRPLWAELKGRAWPGPSSHTERSKGCPGPTSRPWESREETFTSMDSTGPSCSRHCPSGTMALGKPRGQSGVTPKCKGGALGEAKSLSKQHQQRPQLDVYSKLAPADAGSERSCPTSHPAISLFRCPSTPCASTRSCTTQIEQLHWAKTSSFKVF